MPFNPSSAEFVLYNPREQRVIFNLKLSQMSYLALSASFEYISYGYTAIIKLYSYSFIINEVQSIYTNRLVHFSFFKAEITSGEGKDNRVIHCLIG